MARSPELSTGTQDGRAAWGAYHGRVSADELVRAMVQGRVPPLRRAMARARAADDGDGDAGEGRADRKRPLQERSQARSAPYLAPD